jgi:ABC-2 type transport system ATP-binding protein
MTSGSAATPATALLEQQDVEPCDEEAHEGARDGAAGFTFVREIKDTDRASVATDGIRHWGRDLIARLLIPPEAACRAAAPAVRAHPNPGRPARYPERVLHPEAGADGAFDPLSHRAPLIATKGLTRRFGAVVALDALTFEVQPAIIGLVGANGAGKTTLIRILLGLLPPTAGTVLVFGQDVAHHAADIRQLVGYSPEHDCLPPDLSATEFVAHMARISGLPADAARERTAEVLQHVGLYEERYRPIGTYSTGMKQRVKLAQALVHDPRLLLLDEPTNGLDPSGRDDMLDLIRRTGADFGIAIILASHLLGEIERVCDHLLAIDAGRLLQSAPLATFTRRTGVLAVEVEEGGSRLAAALQAHGLRVQADEERVLIVLDDERTFDLVRDLTVDLDLAMVRLEQRRHRLEDLFREPDHGGAEGPMPTGPGRGGADAGSGIVGSAVGGRAP